jgi:EpsI family protein
MSASRIKAVLALLLMAGAAATAMILRPTQYLADMRPKVELKMLFPAVVGDWRVDTRGPVQLISPTQEALISKIYTDTLDRIYVNSAGERIMLSVAYGGDQSDATRAHRPEVCYPAQGFQIKSSRKVGLDVGDRAVSARFLESQLGARHEPLTYWIATADITTTSGAEQKLAQIRYGLKGLIPDGMLVRVSSIDKDTEHAYQVQLDFIRALAAAVDPDVRSRIFGNNKVTKPTAKYHPPEAVNVTMALS